MLITTSQAKLEKSLAKGYLTAGLNLSPATEAALVTGRDLPTLCPKAGSCAEVCLKYAGMNRWNQQARVTRTLKMLDEPTAFYEQLLSEVQKVAAKAKRSNLRFAFRPNLLSDLPKLAQRLAADLPDVQFYDYTKLPKPWLRTKSNYHLTYSYSENDTWAGAQEILNKGINVAMVFDRTKGQDLPATWQGYPVIDGDEDDLRFLDPTGVIVGLRFKGPKETMAPAVAGGFVVTAD